MKKFIYPLIILMFLIPTFWACDNDSENFITQKSELLNTINICKTTSKISPILFNAGVTKIEVFPDTDKIFYEITTEKNVYLNGKNIDFGDYTFVVENNYLFIETSPEYKLSLENNNVYIHSPNYNGYATEDSFLEIEFNILNLFLNELTYQDPKIDALVYLSDFKTKTTAGCSFWNTYYVYGIGANKGASGENLKGEIQKYNDTLQGCKKMGTSSSSCLYGDHGCITSQAYCCDNL